MWLGNLMPTCRASFGNLCSIGHKNVLNNVVIYITQQGKKNRSVEQVKQTGKHAGF
jgi:hypothetical protein